MSSSCCDCEDGTLPAFNQYIGIDYSGAETPDSSLKALRVYGASHRSPAVEVHPPPSKRRYWTRRGIAEWLVECLREDAPSLVGIDHAFSFPLQYFQSYGLTHDWSAFLDDFQRHWPTDEKLTTVDFVREGICGQGAARIGRTRWRRMTEVRSRAAKSVFHFDVPGQVAKSTHAGLPWLRHLRKQLGSRIHFWPFDGWTIPDGRSAVVEVYPRLWSARFARDERTDDQHDAYAVAESLRQSDLAGTLGALLTPKLTTEERTVALLEGWILGVL